MNEGDLGLSWSVVFDSSPRPLSFFRYLDDRLRACLNGRRLHRCIPWGILCANIPLKNSEVEISLV